MPTDDHITSASSARRAAAHAESDGGNGRAGDGLNALAAACSTTPPARLRRSACSALDATARSPNTRPSSRLLLARRLAPCSPEHATSPHAHRPRTLVSPCRPVLTPPHV
eukprot:365930-Chlamydomonas_euryale.AAC.9